MWQGFKGRIGFDPSTRTWDARGHLRSGLGIIVLSLVVYLLFEGASPSQNKFPLPKAQILRAFMILLDTRVT